MTTLGRRMNRRQDRCNLLGLCLTLGAGMDNQNRSKLLGLLLAGFSPRPSNLGCSLGTGSKQDRPHPAQPPNVQEQPVQENRWGRNRVPEPAGPPPGRKAGPAAGHQEGRVPEPAGPPPGREAGRRLLDTKKAECRSLLDRRRQSSLAKESPRPCRCSHLPRKLRRQVLLLLNSARHFRSTPRRMWRCPKSIPKIPPDRLVARTWSERAGKASFRHFRASAERPRPWPKRVRASTHTSSERAVR